jgi:hypothetical protein
MKTKKLVILAALASASGLVQSQSEIDNLISSSNYINTQVSIARQQAQDATQAALAGNILVPGTYTAAQIDMLEVSTYNQALIDVVNANYYTAADFYEDQYQDSMESLGATIEVFSEAATEISKVAAVVEITANTETAEEKVDMQNFIRSSELTLDTQTVAVFNESIEKIETFSQSAAVFKNASLDIDILSTTDTISIDSLSNLTRSTAFYGAYSDHLTVYLDNTDILIHGYFQYGDTTSLLGPQEYLGGPSDGGFYSDPAPKMGVLP